MTVPGTQTGMIPHAQNPYTWEDQMVRPYEAPEPTVLTVADIDRMVAARLRMEAQVAREVQRHACIEAWEAGRTFGREQGLKDATRHLGAGVREVINRQLNHIALRLERSERRKTTIIAERAWMAERAIELRHAIRDLEAL